MDLKIERIFSHAVALDQSSRMKNTIYCFNRIVFILNNEGTVMLRFIIPSLSTAFSNPISFKADDYESGKFQEKDGKVIFTCIGDEFTRSKCCKTPSLTFTDVEKIWESLIKSQPHSTFTIHKKSLSLLEEDLSHLEISSKEKSLVIVQRDIFSGTVITLTRRKAGLDQHKPDNITRDFDPVGIRTGDFMALYSFQDSIQFGVTNQPGYFLLKDGDMEGVVAHCLYDQLGTTEVLHGR